ncbi:MAG: hypothetical protein PHV34_08785 [Verrucomicrobiae bacterium]|nr:hypothetical protein [Verrucomicrobiae bacterium]
MREHQTENNRDGAWTTEPIRAGDPSQVGCEFARVADLKRIFSLSKFMVYELIRNGKIRSFLYRKAGCKNGVRLIHVESVRRYLTENLRTGV